MVLLTVMPNLGESSRRQSISGPGAIGQRSFLDPFANVSEVLRFKWLVSAQCCEERTQDTRKQLFWLLPEFIKSNL